MATSARVYLCQFAQEHVDFRLKELEAVASSVKCSISYNQSDYSAKSPFLPFTTKSEESVRKILKRSVLTRFMYELWGHGRSYCELRESLAHLPQRLIDLCERKDYTFCVRVKGYNKKLSTTYQKDRIEWLSFLPINGRVELSNPTHEFHILEDYGDNPNKAPEQPLGVYFGRLLGAGQRQLIDQYSLKRRYYIGNTSMDAQLSLIMANMAQVVPNSLVFDPFVGTGSILIGCAHFGGYVVGGDIDWSLAHGRGKISRAYSKEQWRGKDDNMRACLRQYGLENQYIDMLVADASRNVWRETELFDAIVTDPPYGVREGSRKVGHRKKTQKEVFEKEEKEVLSLLQNEEDQVHYPSMCSYSTSDVFVDLIEFAAKHLVIGGHLVYWLPVIKEEYNCSLLPSHPCMEIVAASEQALSLTVSRYLITMCKRMLWSSDCSISTRKSDSSLLEDFRRKYFVSSCISQLKPSIDS